jgi:hypothetical protein
MKIKIFGLLVAVALVGGLVVFAAHATGAYFSDTHSGAVAGTIGDIHVTCTGGATDPTSGAALDFNWSGMLPGVPYTATIHCQNTSASNPEDLYINFPNLTALSALNSLGTYGAVTIDVNGTPAFTSNNLNDNLVHGNHINMGVPDTIGALPPQFLLASNVGPTASVTVTFEFEYASDLSSQPPAGQGDKSGWNTYPVVATSTNPTMTGDVSGYAQVTVNAGDGTGSGLPFQIIATEPGNKPTDKGTVAPILP